VESELVQSRFRIAVFFAFCAATVGAVAYFVVKGGSSPSAALIERAPRHVLFITIDTLRADRVGSYGHTAARTPAMDGLARRGTRFARAYAPAPITLTSHASMMTGRYPPRHGARHNGMAVQADAPTLAEAFSRAGFATAAFVSAFPLDKRFGLARGFGAYDDELPRAEGQRRAIERPGAQTVDRAIAWLHAQPAAARLFVWVHLFEPHAPYGPPGENPTRDVLSRYDDEIAIADREVGRLLTAWRELTDTFVILAADHGEAFGEHGEIGHSIFIYDTTLRVPMILAGPGVPPNLVVDEPITVADVAPTIAALSGLPTLQTDGIDLRPMMTGARQASRALYAESFAPLLDFGWAPLRSLRRDGAKLIAAPRPELYDVAVDAAESHNIIDSRARLAKDLADAVDRISGPDLSPQHARIDPSARAQLRALGYVSGGASAGAQRPDPKDRRQIASRISLVTSGELQGAAAEEALRAVLKDDPQNPQAHQRLGFILAESARCREAERHFAAAIAGELPSADPYLGLALCHSQRGAAGEAIATLEAARAVEPGNPVVEANIGLTALGLGRTELAIDALGRAVAIDPDLHQARFALARALGRSGRREAALAQATELLRRLPASAPQRPEVERLVTALR
jgi:choline-sulfatase